MGLLDTLGTLVVVSAGGGMLDEKGNFPRLGRPMPVDAAACIFSCMAGTSTSGADIESAVGIREGARTGPAAVATALLLAGSLFFVPLLAPLQGLRYAHAPALVAVGMLMLSSVARIDFSDLTEVVCHDHDGDVIAQIVDQFLDPHGGDRIESGAGLVHERHFRVES